jgi:hypothetical protein
MADATEQLMGLIPVAVGAAIFTKVLDSGNKKHKKVKMEKIKW